MRWHSASAPLLSRPLQDESADAPERSTGRMLEAQKELPRLCLRHVSIIALSAALLNRGAGRLGCLHTPGVLPEDHQFLYQVGLVTTEPASLFDRCPRDDL